MSPETPAIRIKDLKVFYPVRGGLFKKRLPVRAVDGVSLELKQGETLGLVGESGCGKSSLGRAIIRLNEPTSGTIEIAGTNFLALKGKALRKARTNIQMIFQDPYASLDPRMTVYDILMEPLREHRKASNKELEKLVRSCLDRVNLSARALKKYPHEFSGGQRQRVAIARALVLEPKVIIADEPVSALDVSVQAQILNLLKSIQKDLGLSLVFIAHNLAVVKYISDRIAVMYLGKIVELADREELYENPQHPYTKALVSAVPIPDPHLEKSREQATLEGELPSPQKPPSGCHFHTRCPMAVARCRTKLPQLEPCRTDSHLVSCYEVTEKAPKH